MRRHRSRNVVLFPSAAAQLAGYILLSHSCLVPCRAKPARTLAVPIQRRAPSFMQLGRRSRRLETGVGAVMVRDCDNSEYSGPIGLGTPVQNFEVVFDTGSTALWVTSTSCTDCEEGDNKYDSSQSSTYVEDGSPINLHYEDGSEATGVLSGDVLTVGGLQTQITFGEMASRDVDGCGVVDGIMGMGMAQPRDRRSAFEDLVEAGVVDLPIFGFFMGNIDTDTARGVMTLGGVNQTHYEGCLKWIDTKAQPSMRGYWGVDLKDVKLGSQSVLRSPTSAILDTGTSMIVGPFDDIGYIAQEIGAYCIRFVGASSTSSRIEEVDCKNDASSVELILMECWQEFDDLNFFFGNHTFTLTSAELLLPLTDFVTQTTSEMKEWCLFSMMGHDNNFWIMGDSFLRTFYSAFDVDKKKVGLALSTPERTSDICQDDVAVVVDSTTAPVSPDAPSPAPTAVGTPAATSAGTPAATSAGTPAPADETPEATAMATPEPSPAPQTGTTGIFPTGDQPDTASDHDSTEGGDGNGQKWSMAGVAAMASTVTLVVVGVVAGLVVLVRRVNTGGKKGGGGEATVASGTEDDFLQAGPGGYRSNGSGSHVYRVGNNGNDGANGVTLANGCVGDEDDEEEDEEVEVNFGGSAGQNSHSGATVETGAMGRGLSRLFGPRRAGFAELKDSQEGIVGRQEGGRTSV